MFKILSILIDKTALRDLFGMEDFGHFGRCSKINITPAEWTPGVWMGELLIGLPGPICIRGRLIPEGKRSGMDPHNSTLGYVSTNHLQNIKVGKTWCGAMLWSKSQVVSILVNVLGNASFKVMIECCGRMEYQSFTQCICWRVNDASEGTACLQSQCIW